MEISICMEKGEEAGSIGRLEKCTTPFVQIVDRQPRFPSNPTRTDLFTAGTATGRGSLPATDG